VARRQVESLRAAEAAMDRVVRADRATLELRLSEIARLERDLAALQALREEAARNVASQERRATGAEAQAALLSRQLDELRGQLSRLNAALGDSEGREREGEAERRKLQAQLAAALAQRVEELTRYRSEFFGRLRGVLGDRPEVRVQGDRFVFQSEVLFPPGGADLSPAGREQLRQLARVLGEISRGIPPEIAWVLRVDGHADRQPIRPGARFASNWELSAARAIAVANLMIESGIPANRVAAAAFGEHQPLDPGDTPEAFARNRRIELRLTDR
jgi:chemotaxis protein MotB